MLCRQWLDQDLDQEHLKQTSSEWHQRDTEQAVSTCALF